MSNESANGMRDVIERWRDVAIDVPSHMDVTVADKPVAWWFDKNNATTEAFMKALAGDSQLVVPGKPEESQFYTRFLKLTRPMGERLKDARATIEKWIVDGAPVPDEPTPGTPAETDFVRFTADLSDAEVKAREPEYFHQLINIEDFSEFLEDARALARFYFKQGRKNQEEQVNEDPASFFGDFDYTEKAFDARMKSIYDAYVDDDMYVPHRFDRGVLPAKDEKGVQKNFPIGRVSNRVPRERLFQVAPFNLVDGAWLQNIIMAGPSNKIQSNLFSIWDDEAGNGVVSQNHSNVYDALLKSQNIYLPPVTTREFIKEDFLPGAFTGPVFQLAVGQFPQEFFPELLGMTLYLEWEATPTMTPAARMLAGRGINPHFYRLHIAIDNISEGHGALAKEAIKLYLSDKREEGGEAAVQEHWKRIWNGYVTWATLSDFGQELVERYLVLERKQINISADPAVRKCWPDYKEYNERRMLHLVSKKAAVAEQVHRGRSVGGQSLTALFKNPPRLLEALKSSGYVDPNRPRDSKFLELMDFNGPMYEVFTERDKDIILDWIESLRPSTETCVDPESTTPTPVDLPGQVAKLIADKAESASLFHDGITLTISEGKPVPLKELFQKPAELMHALVVCGWIVPHEDGRSMFITRLLRDDGPMTGVFSEAEVTTIREWVKQGAKPPTDEAMQPASILETKLSVDDEVPSDRTETSWAERRQLIGMGSVH
jgi:hypothetical protein